MARALWKGTISFGLVTIPVELQTAVREQRPRFRLLHAKDLSPVEYRRVCRKDGKAVAWEDLVKGYEYERGRFVVLTKDDFETAALEKSRTVQVLDFVKEEAIETPSNVVDLMARLKESLAQRAPAARTARKGAKTGGRKRGRRVA